MLPHGDVTAIDADFFLLLTRNAATALVPFTVCDCGLTVNWPVDGIAVTEKTPLVPESVTVRVVVDHWFIVRSGTVIVHGIGVGIGVGVGVGVGDGLGDGDGDGTGVGVGLGVGDGDGELNGVAVNDTSTVPPAGTVAD